MDNYQWLLQMDGADRKAWFDAEHVETEERALDGDTDALNAKIAELTAERDYYRDKFGKCLDCADVIHALIADEGLA